VSSTCDVPLYSRRTTWAIVGSYQDSVTLSCIDLPGDIRERSRSSRAAAAFEAEHASRCRCDIWRCVFWRTWRQVILKISFEASRGFRHESRVTALSLEVS
jgi:hypothetical protein